MEHLIITAKTDLEILIQKIVRSEIERFANEKKQPTKETPEFLTIQEACKLLNLAKPTIYGHVSKRNLPHIKRGKKLMFKRESLIAWLEQGNRRALPESNQNRVNY